MRYYDDRPIRSTQSPEGPARMLQGSDLTLVGLLQQFAAVPDSTWCVLEQAEAVAARAARDRSRLGFDPPA